MLCRRHWLSVYRTCSKTHQELRSVLKIKISAGEAVKIESHSYTCFWLVFLCLSCCLFTYTSSLSDFIYGRALEASLAERQGSLQHVGLSLTGISVDPLNPHERERQGYNPVGLKNIGNTCWFSAVIQVLSVCLYM